MNRAMLRELGQTFSSRMRARRFDRLESLVSGLARPLRILDVGGTNEFWEACGWAEERGIQITLVNQQPQSPKHSNIVPLVGDATNLGRFSNGSYDLAFSNSVIEHLFTWERQLAMASEIQRVGKAYWVQTPNYWFPIEPHFHFVGWQWLPESLRVAILRRRSCGWRGPTPDPVVALRQVREVRLLSRRQLRRLFPAAHIEAESFLGLVKSWIVIGGLSHLPPVDPKCETDHELVGGSSDPSRDGKRTLD